MLSLAILLLATPAEQQRYQSRNARSAAICAFRKSLDADPAYAFSVAGKL